MVKFIVQQTVDLQGLVSWQMHTCHKSMFDKAFLSKCSYYKHKFVYEIQALSNVVFYLPRYSYHI